MTMTTIMNCSTEFKPEQLEGGGYHDVPAATVQSDRDSAAASQPRVTCLRATHPPQTPVPTGRDVRPWESVIALIPRRCAVKSQRLFCRRGAEECEDFTEFGF
jgi:hypothetical protein